MYHCWNCHKPVKCHSNSVSGVGVVCKCSYCGVVVSKRGRAVSVNNSLV